MFIYCKKTRPPTAFQIIIGNSHLVTFYKHLFKKTVFQCILSLFLYTRYIKKDYKKYEVIDFDSLRGITCQFDLIKLFIVSAFLLRDPKRLFNNTQITINHVLLGCNNNYQII